MVNCLLRYFGFSAVAAVFLSCATLVNTLSVEQPRIKYIRVIIHVFNKSDGSGSFQPDKPRDLAWLQEKIDDANYFLANPEENVPPAPPVEDSYIRLRLMDIKFWNNDTAYAVKTNTPYNHRNLFLDYARSNEALSAFERDSCLHIMLSGVRPKHYGGRNICLLPGCDDGLGFANNVLYFEGMYHVYLDTFKFGEVGGHIVHELGHGLGLPHYNFEMVRYIRGKGGIPNPCYPCTIGQPCEWRKWNNFMKSTEGGRGMDPCQVKYMHLLLENGPDTFDIFHEKCGAHKLWEY